MSRSGPGPKAAAASVPRELPLAGARIGRVLGRGEAGTIRVEFAGGPGPLSARTTIALRDDEVARAAREGRGAVLLFEEGDPARPIVVGLVQSPTPQLDAVLEAKLPGAPRVARVDGERVDIEGREEVVLRCGKASLTLRRDGLVLVRGVNIRTVASGVQKIRGGKIEIN